MPAKAGIHGSPLTSGVVDDGPPAFAGACLAYHDDGRILPMGWFLGAWRNTFGSPRLPAAKALPRSGSDRGNVRSFSNQRRTDGAKTGSLPALANSSWYVARSCFLSILLTLVSGRVSTNRIRSGTANFEITPICTYDATCARMCSFPIF
jgi:hypothetical protein